MNDYRKSFEYKTIRAHKRKGYMYRFKTLIEEKKLTNAQFANKSGVNLSTVYNILNGKIGIGAHTALKISRFCNVSIEFILTGKNN